MELYQAYIIGDDGRIIGFDKIECRNDDEALQKVSRLVDVKRVEIWTGPRLVTVLRNESREGNTSAP
jgi:hypothetical protein